MAFCSCGTQVVGAYCGRCGAPASVAVRTEAPEPPPRQSQPQPQAQAASIPSARRENREAFWIFAIAGGLTVLGMVGTVVAAQRLKKAGVDLDLLWHNPALGLERVNAIVRPDIELLSTNDRDGSITVRNRQTGTMGTITFEDGGHGDSVVTHREGGRTISHYAGRYAAARLPTWVPAYPRTSAGGFAGITWGDDGETGAFNFTTPDPAWKVQSFYEGKAREMNMQVETEVPRRLVTEMKLTDAATHRTMTVGLVRKDPVWVSVSYASK